MDPILFLSDPDPDPQIRTTEPGSDLRPIQMFLRPLTHFKRIVATRNNIRASIAV